MILSVIFWITCLLGLALNCLDTVGMVTNCAPLVED